MVSKVLILMSRAGGGHESCARAVAAALDQEFPGKFRASIRDVLAEGLPPPLNQVYRLYGFLAEKGGPFWGFLFRATSSRKQGNIYHRILSILFRRRLLLLLRDEDPHLVIATHPLAHQVLELPKYLFPEVPFFTVVTDLVDVHALWAHSRSNLCFVPTEQAQRQVVALGMPLEKTIVTGLPVHPDFSRRAADAKHLWESLGLRPDLFAVLLVGGGLGMGRMDAVAQAVDEAGFPLQLILVAGRNEGLRRRWEDRRWKVPTRIFGFTHEMPLLMKVADVILTKAGAATIAEALVSGLPLVLTAAVPGQEVANVDYVVRGGAGVYAPNPSQAVAALREFWSSPRRLTEMKEAAGRLAQPEAAPRIARIIAQTISANATSGL